MKSFRTPRSIVDVLHRVDEDDGQALVEYSLLLSLIAIVCFISVQAFGLGVGHMFSHIVSVYP